MSKLQNIIDLLPDLTAGEKMSLLRHLANDITQTFPGIDSCPGVCGGDPCITRTRIPVWLLEQARRQGLNDAAILQNYPQLQAEDLANAWTYVRSHRNEIDTMIGGHEKRSLADALLEIPKLDDDADVEKLFERPN